jgi:hypothetical protein
MKFTVAVSALLMASAYGFAPNSASVRQVSARTSSDPPAKVLGVILSSNIVLTYSRVFAVNFLLEDGALQILTLRKEMG